MSYWDSKVYVIRYTLKVLSDEHEENGKTLYRRCDEHTIIDDRAFFNYETAAHAAQRLIKEYGDRIGVEWDPEDVEKWDWFFIGFHHGCTIKQKHDPELEKVYEQIGVPKQHRVLKIELIELNLT